MMYAEEIVGSEDEKMSEASSTSVNSSLVVSCSKGALVSDSTDFDSSSTGNSSGGSQKKRKRRTEGKDKFHRASLEMEVKRAIPKSVTPDVRYTYTGLLAHVYNSCDYDLMYQFLHTYYRQDFILQQELTGNFPDALKGLIEVRGRTLAGKYWYERMHDSPDVVFRIEHVNIIINDETMNGIIQCKFNLQGSQIMNAMDPVFNSSMMTTDQDKKIITLTDEDDHVVDTDKPSNGEDFDAILDGATELDFGFHEIPSASLTDTKFLPDDQAETFAINPVNQFYHNVSDALQKRDEFAGLKVPKVETKPVLLLNKAPSQQGRIMTIHYNYQGAVEMHFDADSLIYYSKFVLCNL